MEPLYNGQPSQAESGQASHHIDKGNGANDTERPSAATAHNTSQSGEQLQNLSSDSVPTATPATSGTMEELRAEQNTASVDTVTDKMKGESMSLPPDSPTKNLGSTIHGHGNDNSGSDGDSSDKERSRKRKLSNWSSTTSDGALRVHPKRPKESDVSEREEESEENVANVPSEASVQKPTQVFGFGSFASANSPFVGGDVKAASPKPASPPVDNSDPQSQQTDTPPPSAALVTAQSASLPAKPSGFAAFASGSPFKRSSITLPSPSSHPPEQRESLAGPVRRSRSPIGKNQAFGQYSAGLSRFGTPTSRKLAQEDKSEHPSDSGRAEAAKPVIFEDMLKTKGNDNANHVTERLDIQEIEHNTGEEDDLTVFQTRAKLYTQDETFAYKERGTGLLKINVRRHDGEGARIVMRAEGVLRLLLNMPLYPGLICELGPDPKFIKVAEITTQERRLHAVKVGNAKVAQELYDHLIENTPSKLHSPHTD